ncbi:MAG: hypothetical protein ABI165_20865, partial [Bryobacteraceae bacterium]
MPILLGFRTLRWVADGAVEIGQNPGPADARQSNLVFDDDHLVVSAALNGRKVPATLDTGAIGTDLYAAFAQQFPSLLAAS